LLDEYEYEFEYEYEADGRVEGVNERGGE